MNPWERFAAAAPAASGPWSKFQPPAAQPQSQGEAAAAAAAQGILFNFGDEAKAAVQAAVPGVIDFLNTPLFEKDAKPANPASRAPTWQQRYEENLAGNRAQEKANVEAYPISTTAGNVGGAVLGTTAALPARLTTMGPSLVGNVAKLGATGAALGATAGFGSGEGGTEERLGAALLPATVGGALGAGLPLIGALGRSVVESTPGRAVADRVAAALTRNPEPVSVAQQGAAQRLATALQRANLDPSDVRVRLDELGEGAMLADVDQQMATAARTARSMPGQTRSLAERVFDERQLQMPGIMRSAFEGPTPPPARHTLMGEGKAFDLNTRAVGQQAYQGDMVNAGLTQSPKMREMLDNPAVDAAIKKVTGDISAARQMRPDAPNPTPVEVMHMVKREIAKLGEDATGRAGSTQQVWRDLADDFVRTLKSDNPALAEADRMFAQAKSLPEFYEQGASFLAGGPGEKGMNASSAALADALMGANPQQVAAVRAGTTNRVSEMTSGTNALGQARGLARDVRAPEIQARLGEIYEPSQAAQIQRAGDAVRTFDKTERFVRGGSQSIDKGMDAVDDMANIRINASSGGLGARLWDTAEGIWNRAVAPNEAIRDAIGQAMLNPNTAENKKILDLAAALLGQRAQGRPIAAGLIEGTASQTGGR